MVSRSASTISSTAGNEYLHQDNEERERGRDVANRSNVTPFSKAGLKCWMINLIAL